MFCLILLGVIFSVVHGGVPHLLRSVDYPLVVPETGRIVGGEETTIENVPYIVAMFVSGRHWCGGSIIKDNVILTAAHCVQGNTASRYSIRAGSTNVSSGGQVVRVTRYTMHPDYQSPKIYSHDVGLLLLSSSITLGETARIIPMNAQGDNVPDGTIARISGWGKVEFATGVNTEALRTVLVPVVNQEVCSNIYYGYISNDMICAGVGGKGSCSGDSGGPLVSEVDTVQIGIVSWAKECALETHPTVFARVASVRDWVDTYL